MDGDFDYIVAGAGTAGCVLAARLSASGRHRVLLLEAGGEARSPWIGVPIGYARLLGDARVNWLYRTLPEPFLHDRVLEQPCGKVIGGTGSINGLLHVQGQREDYDGWRDLGLDGWGWDDVQPWFGRLALSVAAPPRHELADAFIAAAVQAGHPANGDFNGPSQEGAGYYRLNTRGGRRDGTARAYLAPARARPNLAVQCNALVDRVLLENGEAAGVAYRVGGEARTARARREVVVCAGTFNSPLLLQRSGIGPGALLQRHGIPVRRDVPAVGGNLQNHYRASLVVRCARPVTHNDVMASVWRQAAMVLRYALFRDGPMAAGTYVGGFFRTDPASPRPDAQVTFWTYSVERRDAGGVVLHGFPGFTANAVILRPQSLGRVALGGADPAAAPAISYHHLEDERDGRTLVAALRLLRRILAQPALAPYHAGEIAPGDGCTTEDALLDYARRTGGSVFHPVGTCAMGAVTDARLRVNGVGRLRVADASVMPRIVSGNTNAPTAMIAERCAAWLEADAA